VFGLNLDDLDVFCWWSCDEVKEDPWWEIDDELSDLENDLEE
jgi:hypothetical protein